MAGHSLPPAARPVRRPQPGPARIRVHPGEDGPDGPARRGPAMSLDGCHLLDDDAMKRFITQGYLVVETDFPESFHQEVCRSIEGLLARRGNPGNEILEEVPALQEVYDHPTVRGALVSLLGLDVRMSPHRHCHASPPGMRGQRWHQDDVNNRHHRIERVLAMYYPHDVSVEMGPTLLMPYTAFRNAPTARMAS